MYQEVKLVISKERLQRTYYKLFGISEIENQTPLQWIFWAMLAYLFYNFSRWGFSNNWITKESAEQLHHTCWPYFLNCGDYYFLSSIFHGYSQTILYGFFLIIFTLAAVAAVQKKWVVAHFSMLILFLWKFIYTFVLTFNVPLVFPIFSIPMVFLWLFAKNKLFFLRLCLVVLYFCAAIVKFHPSWIVGTYFSSLQYGLPLVPNWSIPFATNTVIALEIFSPWLLLSNNHRVRTFALAVWLAFHFYSSLLIGYKYPLICVPMLLSLYTKHFQFKPKKNGFKPGLGSVTIILLLIGNLIPLFNMADQKYTLEHTKFNLAMFDANHQCQSERRIFLKNGETRTRVFKSQASMGRCNPYFQWYTIRGICQKYQDNIKHIEWSYYSSINGNPFYAIIDEKDACLLKYTFLGHNPWIQTPATGAKIIGYPKRNSLGYTFSVDSPEPLIFQEPTIKLSPSQKWFQKNYSLLKDLWLTLWWLTLFAVVFGVARRKSL